MKIKSYHVLTSIFLIALLTSMTFLFLQNKSQPEVQGKNVIDCRESSYTCNKTKISQRPLECPNHWAPWSPKSDLDCSYTSENIDSVSLVADSANYITSPKTESDYQTEFIGSTGSNPWDLEFLPSGKPIWTNQNGKIRYMQENGSKTVLDKINVTFEGTTGLQGLAIDPEFSENNYIYLFYNYGERNLTYFVNESKVNLRDFDDDPTTPERRDRFVNRISRFEITDEGLSNEKILLKNIPSSDHVSGGRIEFGPDNKLYATTSGANLLHLAASKSSLAGKTLRLNKDGTVPDDNPFEDSYIYSRSHKNPIGIAWHPETNDLYNTEHGAWRHDEINHIRPGENYGWYGYQCDEKYDIHFGRYQQYYEGSPEEYFKNTAPERCFENWTIAPAGATFVDDPDHPWYGDMFVAGLRSKNLFRLNFEDGISEDGEVFYVSDNESRISLRLRDVEFYNNSLYVIGDLGGLVEISPN